MFRRDFDQKMKILSVVNSDMFVLVVTKFRMINAPPRATWAEKYFRSLPISSYRYLSLGGYRDGDGFVLNWRRGFFDLCLGGIRGEDTLTVC